MTFAVTEQDRQAFERDGVIVLRGAIDSSWRDRLAQAIERDIAKPGPHFHNFRANTGRFHATSRVREKDADAAAYIFESSLPEIAAFLMRSRKVNLLYDQIFAKEPGTDAPSPWHQDHGVWPIEGRQVMTFWLALDPVTRQSGGLEWLRGSHLWGRKFQPTTMGGRVYEPMPGYEPMPDIEAQREKYEILTWDMQPGDLLAFHSLTVHGARGNSTQSTRRRAFSVRFTGDDVCYAPRSSTMTELANPALAPGDVLDSPMFPVVWLDGHRSPTPDPY